jgi:opacity protein-like surface antigen
MKKFVVTISLIVLTFSTLNAQVLFNTAQTIQKSNWSLGINPAFADWGNSDFALFFHGGYGIGNNSDLGLKLGFGWGDTYVGLDYEKTIKAGKPLISLHGGGHFWKYFGLDFGATVSFPVSSNLYISTGLDMDLNFTQDNQDKLDLKTPLWLPISLEVYLQKHLSLVFEGNVKLTQAAFTTVGGGINIYF